MEAWTAFEAICQNDPDRLTRWLGLGDVARPSRGRRPPAGTDWRAGSFRSWRTTSLTVDSTADDEATAAVIMDFERVLPIWVRLWFPFWRPAARFARAAAAGAIDDLILPPPIPLHLAVHRTVDDYRASVGRSVGGGGRSTGYFDPRTRVTHVVASEDVDAVRTRRHEWTHALFASAVQTSIGRSTPGRRRDFWVVEGIAGYMESLTFDDAGSAVSGGWDASRLSFARHRLDGGPPGGGLIPVARLRDLGRDQALAGDDLAGWYTSAIATVHAAMHSDGGRHRAAFYRLVDDVYRCGRFAGDASGVNAIDTAEHVRVDGGFIVNHPTDRRLDDLSLAGCDIDADALAAIPSSDRLRWLDLSGIAVDSDGVARLVERPERLEQLALSRTAIDDGLSGLLSRTDGLRELDLIQTSVTDAATAALSGGSLQIVYLTATGIGDDTLSSAAKWSRLRRLDVQRTAVTDEALDRFRRARPDVELNPLAIRVGE